MALCHDPCDATDAVMPSHLRRATLDGRTVPLANRTIPRFPGQADRRGCYQDHIGQGVAFRYAPRMTQLWEHEYEHVSSNAVLQERLKSRSRGGWELVTALRWIGGNEEQYGLFWKRPLG